MVLLVQYLIICFYGTNWKLSDAVDFKFPDGAVINANGFVVVALASAVPAELVPLSPPPQPASAIARLPVNRVATIRPTTRSAFLIKTPESDSDSGQARDEVTIVGCTSVQLWVQLA